MPNIAPKPLPLSKYPNMKNKDAMPTTKEIVTHIMTALPNFKPMKPAKKIQMIEQLTMCIDESRTEVLEHTMSIVAYGLMTILETGGKWTPAEFASEFDLVLTAGLINSALAGRDAKL